METHLATLAQMLRDNLDRLDKLVSEHERVLFGSKPEREDSLSLTTKVDRLWESNRRMRWYLRAAGGVIFTLLGAAAAHFLGLS